MLGRERRTWTEKEDQLLRDAVKQEDTDQQNPSRWSAIAKHVPDRTNKDCRKRWFVKMAMDVVKGSWAPDEDQRLIEGITQYGYRWSLIAAMVQTRNSDQCAKRWTDTLNPDINRTTWSAEADELLLEAVGRHGRVWSKIVKMYFPGRTGLSAKNRYNSLTQFHRGRSRSAAMRTSLPYSVQYNPDSPSPPPTSLTVPAPRTSLGCCAELPHTPPETKDNLIAFHSCDMPDPTRSVKHSSALPFTSLNPSYQQFSVVPGCHTSHFPPDKEPGFLYHASHVIPPYNKPFLELQGNHPELISLYRNHSRRSSIPGDDPTNHFAPFDILPSQPVQAELYWEAAVPVSHVNRRKANLLSSSL